MSVTRRLTRRFLRALISCAIAASIAGCAGGGASDALPHAYDFGIGTPTARMPAVRLDRVRAVQPFDRVAMHYRLAYRDGAELGTFAASRWAAPPPELVRKQIARAMQPGAARCALDIEVQEFSQVFSQPDTSAAQLELVATLVSPADRIGTRVLRLSEPNGGANAAQGVASMQRAVARAVAELARWVESVSACRG
jgi:cholesterol transport system auxiliary component